MTDIQQLITELGSDDPKQAYQARHALSRAVDLATDPAKNREREVLAAMLAAELIATVERKTKQVTNVPGSDVGEREPKLATPVRRLLCQFLNQIASDNEVPALATALEDLEIREAARGVLESLGTMAATRPLVAATAYVGPDFRVGVLNSLGPLRWREAFSVLSRHAESTDAEIRLAAVEGLANFPEDASDALIVAATKVGSPHQRGRAQKARVRLAETLHQAGEKTAAMAIYRSIAADPNGGSWTAAAHRALAPS